MGLEPTIFHLKLYNSSQDLMKLRFFKSPCRRDSERCKVIGKKQIYLEKNILHRQYGQSQKARGPPNIAWLVLIGLIIS